MKSSGSSSTKIAASMIRVFIRRFIVIAGGVFVVICCCYFNLKKMVFDDFRVVIVIHLMTSS